jgi:hypothetical protein
MADHAFDPRLRRKIRWMSDVFPEVNICSDVRAEWFRKEGFSSSYEVIDYNDDSRLRSFQGGICYVSGARILLDKKKILLELSKNNKIVFEIPDLPLRSNMRFINLIKLAMFNYCLSKVSNYGIVTSDKFLKYLPRTMPYFVSENILDKRLGMRLADLEQVDISGHPVNIAFVGAFRYDEQLRMVIRFALKRSSLVNLHFYGGPVDRVDQLISMELSLENNNRRRDNIIVHGPYDFENDIIDIYKNIDMLYSVYDARQMNVQLALPNKLYEAGLSKRWILCANNTYLSEIVNKYNIGCSLPFLLKNFSEFEAGLDKFINKVRDGAKFNTDYSQKIVLKSHTQKQEFLNFINSLCMIN